VQEVAFDDQVVSSSILQPFYFLAHDFVPNFLAINLLQTTAAYPISSGQYRARSTLMCLLGILFPSESGSGLCYQVSEDSALLLSWLSIGLT